MSKYSRDEEVYFFKRDEKHGVWEKGFVRAAEPHFLKIYSRKDRKGLPIKAAYENVRKVPDLTLLKELDDMEFLFPRSYSIIDEDKE